MQGWGDVRVGKTGTMREVWEEPKISVAASGGGYVPKSLHSQDMQNGHIVLVCPGVKRGRDV